MRWLDAPYTATPFDGIHRMTAWRRGLGSAVHHTHGGRLLPTMGLEALSAKPRLSPPAEGHTIYPYLLREMTVRRNTQVWRTDIPSIRLPVGFVSLMAVMDWFSRSGLVLGGGDHHGRAVVSGGAGAGPARWPARDLQHRPRRPVYQSGVYRAAVERGADQPGWPRSGPGHRVRRALVANRHRGGSVAARLPERVGRAPTLGTLLCV
jgi:hypothetical protein